MSEEIFGPILPIMKMDYRQACSLTSKLEHPLGLYIFSTNQAEIDESTSYALLLVDPATITRYLTSSTQSSRRPIPAALR